MLFTGTRQKIQHDSTSAVLHIAPRIRDTLGCYEDDLFARKLSQRTIDTYLREIRAVSAWIDADATLADLTPQSIAAYQRSRKSFAAATLGKTVAALRSYCAWCVRSDLRLDNPAAEVEPPKRPKTLPKPLSSTQLTLLHTLLSTPLPDWREKRRASWVRACLLMLYAGLRISEVASLDWRDIDLDVSTLFVRGGKGAKDRLLPIHARLLSDLTLTPPVRRRGLVVGLSLGGIRHIFDRWLRHAGLHVSAHQLRHTFATRLLWAGADIKQIQELMGHESLATTERYLGLDTTRSKAAIALLPDEW